MLRMWVLTVFTGADSTPAISGRERLDLGQRTEGSGRIALDQADRRAGIADLARVRSLVGEGREGGAGLAGHPEAGLGAQHPAGHLACQRVRAR